MAGWTAEQERLIGVARRLAADGRAASPRRLEDEGVDPCDLAGAFGNAQGLRVAAGLQERPRARRLAAAVARHEAVLPAVEAMEAERDALANRERMSPARGRYASALVCADVHDLHVDPFWLTLWLEAVARSRPFVDTIVLDGDVWDAYEFSNYAKKPDTVAKAHARWRFVKWFIAETRRRNPDARLVWIEGNHEHRLLRWFAESAGSALPLLQEINGWGRLDTILGVSEHDLTYVSRASLKAETKGAAQKEVASRNWWVWEDAVVFCHYPPAKRALTRPYVSGHHHAYKVESYSCHVQGSIKWLQLGCGCAPKADYCDAERLWDRGFAFVHLDRDNLGREGAVQLEYVHVGRERARLMGDAYAARAEDSLPLAPFLA